jgi:hypothetical protein
LFGGLGSDFFISDGVLGDLSFEAPMQIINQVALAHAVKGKNEEHENDERRESVEVMGRDIGRAEAAVENLSPRPNLLPFSLLPFFPLPFLLFSIHVCERISKMFAARRSFNLFQKRAFSASASQVR